MLQANTRNSHLCFLTAFGLVNMLCFTLLLGSATFLSGHTLSSWQFPLGLAIALFLNYRAALSWEGGNGRRLFYRSCLAMIAISGLSLAVALFFYDVSFDGQSYHMESVYQLGTSWNPVKTELPDSINLTEAIYVNHYPKGSEIPQGAIYHLTGKIESGKATNLVLFGACFFLCLAYLYRQDRFSFRKKLWISALFTLSPVTMGELISFYVDGQMALLLLSLLILCALLYAEQKWYYLFMLTAVMIILVNLKFTGVLFVAVSMAGFLLLLAANKKMALFRQIFVAGAVAAILGAGLAGYYPYLTNALNHGSPFYPVMGPVKKDIISNVYPESFKDKNRFEKFYISFFSHTNELKIYEDKNPKVPPKIPFTFNRTDLSNAPKLGVKMAGFGPFFSGAVLLSLVLFVLMARKNTDRTWFSNCCLVLGTLLLSVFAVPEAWWARLVPQLWLFPLLIAFLSESFPGRTTTFVRGSIYALLAINILLASLIIPWNLVKSEEVKYQISQLKASGDTLRVEFSYFKSNRIRLRENGIPYIEQKVGDQHVDYLVRSSTRFEPPAHQPSLPEPWLLSRLEGLKKKLKQK
jgi:hypothetical protein